DVEAGSDYPFQFLGKPLIDAGMRYAKAVNDNFAFKINASMMKGEDWYADDTTNIRVGNIHWEYDPGHDALNKYGDEITQEMPIGENNKNIIVTRTGYMDKVLVDNNVKSFKLSGSLHYRLGEKTTAILHGNYGDATTVYTGDNRISLSGFRIYQGKAEINGSNFMIRGYGTKQQSGDTYDTRYLAYNLNRQYSSDKQWFFDYYNAYAGNLRRFGVRSRDHRLARAFADRNRLEPGTTTFAGEKERLINSTDFTDGARLINHSGLMHFEGKYNFNEWIPWADFEIGSNYRFYDLVSKGSVFPDTADNDITFYEYGGYLKASKKLLDEDLSVTASVRYDKSENFTGHFSPRISALYTFREKHNFRASFLTGYRNPGAKEQFMNKDIGPARLLGGLNELVSPYNLPMNGIFRKKIYEFNDAVDADQYSVLNPYNSDQAILKNMDILTEGIVEEEDIGNLQPEKVVSFELGYKSKLFDKLFVDAVYYRSTYENFIGYAEIVKPRTSPDVDLFTAATQVNNSTQSDVFYIYSNSHEKVTIQGVSAGMKYLFPIGAVISANATWSNLQTEIDDPIVPGFNTPVFKSNISVSNRRL
ncbi:MAG: TonB-dependent receptor, partial [Bacteroidales bacterium]|nr:TonB-dependent receptor [Bacteroidales bacterium]